MDKTCISVITVCKNAEKSIEYTIKSVLDQDYAAYEYLIWDGLSDDSTVTIAERFSDYFTAKNIPFRIISEKDGGIYDAMNKAAEYADGERILYLNAGDALFDRNTLSKLAAEISERYDVIYGNAALSENGKYKLLKAKDGSMFKYTNPVCHQAALTKKEVIIKYPFEKNYAIAADFDQFLKIYLSNEQALKKLDFTVCIFLLGGISGNEVLKRETEFNESRKKNGLKRVFLPHLQILENVLIDRIRRIAVRVLGPGFYSERRGWYSDRYKAVRETEIHEEEDYRKSNE